MANRFYVIADLRKQYAKLLGRHNAAERLTENAKGLKAMDAATARVAAERRALEEQMAAIRQTIQSNYDPKWSPAGIKPIMPPVTGAHGDLSKATYAVLKAADGNLPIGEIVEKVGLALKLDLTDKSLKTRVRIGVQSILNARAKDGLVHREGSPFRWSRAPRPMLQPPVSANSLPTPWR